MDKNLEAVRRAQVERTIKALAQNRIPAVYAPTREEAVEAVRGMLSPGEVVTCGGSMTLAECGIQDLLKSGAYEFLDRTVMDPQEVYRRTFSADVFLTSANAITEEGELSNVDGNGNRVASMLYGHQKVYLVAGRNKLAPTYEEALWRARNIAAPKNAQRLGKKTPCAVKGDRCYDCKSPERICRGLAVLWEAMSGVEMEVVLVDEDLGY